MDSICPLIQRVARHAPQWDYLRSAATSDATDQAVLFEVAHGFEQTVWLLHRFALLLPQA